MRTQNPDETDTRELTAEEWRDQRLVGAELRRLRESAGMTREELAEKMGASYSARLVEQYEDGGVIPMEIQPVFAMARVLRGNMNTLDPVSLMSKLCLSSGYADLTDESRQMIDRITGALVKE